MAYYTATYLSLEMRWNRKEHPTYGDIPARPMNYKKDSWRHRIWLAYQVFTGRMDAVQWAIEES